MKDLFKKNKAKNKNVSIKREKKYQLSIFGNSPKFDWNVILIISFVLLVLIIFSSYTFYKDLVGVINQDLVPGNTNGLVDEDHLQKIIDENNEKKNEFNSLWKPSSEQGLFGDNVTTEDVGQ